MNFRKLISFALSVLALSVSPLAAEVRFDTMATDFLKGPSDPGELVPGTDRDDARFRTGFEHLVRADGQPFACASPVVLETLRHRSEMSLEERIRTANLLTAPRLAGAKLWRGGDGTLLVRYSDADNSSDALPRRDRDNDGTPDALEILDRAYRRAREVVEDRVGWSMPPSTALQIVLARLDGPRAYLLPERWSSFNTVREAVLVLDPRVLASETESISVLAHQMAHAHQWQHSLEEEPWFYEATAAWIGLEASGDLSTVLPSLRERSRRPERSLRAGELDGALGAVQFLLYLDEVAGSDLIERVWDSMGGEAGGVMEVLDRELFASTQIGVAEHVRRYHLWNLATGGSDLGAHYVNGSLLPEPSRDAIVRNLPESGIERAHAPRGLGANYLEFQIADVDSGVQLRFSGDAGSQWAADVVGVPHEESGFERIPMAVDSKGNGTLAVPGSRYKKLVLVVHNLSDHPDSVGAYSWSADVLPRYPFELSRIQAEPSRGQILLQWTSITEQDLYGWRIMTAESERGPWVAANTPVVPAIGQSGSTQDYSWLDNEAIGGVRRWYRVEGITVHGVPVASGTVSAVPTAIITPEQLLRRSARR